MSRKIIYLVLVVALLFPMGLSVAAAAPLGQEKTYTVVLGDNLWTLAEKYLGSGAAYRAIALATNAKNKEDATFAQIKDVSLIYPGWKFLIPSAEEAEKLLAQVVKVGQVTDVGGIDDRSFNQTAWKGVQDGIEQLGIQGRYLESQSAADYEPNINTFLSEKYDMIITVGFMIMDATFAGAKANPDVDWVWVDGFSDPAVTNLAAVVTATDGPAFLAGYLAAGMTKTGKVATYGGIQLPTVEIFMVGFEHGVKYYNEQHGTSVAVLGWNSDTRTGTFTGDFENTDNGRRVTESFLDEGADIVLPVAGPVGLGTAAVCLERGCKMIGVDADMYYTAPDYASIMLTSVMKNMDVAVFQAIRGEVSGAFQGGSDYLLTLANDGAQLAPFHDFDSQVPQSLKDELVTIKAGLIDGTIKTGWPLP